MEESRSSKKYRRGKTVKYTGRIAGPTFPVVRKKQPKERA